jgi:hypothetical protein
MKLHILNEIIEHLGQLRKQQHEKYFSTITKIDIFYSRVV